MSAKEISPPAHRKGATRLWMKLLVAGVVPLGLFLFLEVGLRLAGVGHSSDFFIRDGAAGSFRSNPHFADLYLPASFGLKPLNYRISREKPANAVRIFVVGESAAMGVPEPGFGVAPQLRAQLRAAYPEKTFEVFNLGMTAINSHVLRHVVQEVVGFRPDVLVIYAGNNEVVGPYGPGTFATSTIPPLWLIRTSLWVRRFRVAQAIEALIVRLTPKKGFKEWRGMELFAANAVGPRDPRMRTVYANFAANLHDMIAAAEKAGVKTIVSTVAVNLSDSPPFGSRQRSDLSEDEIRASKREALRARTALESGDAAAARVILEHVLAKDPNDAEAHFMLGRALSLAGDGMSARQQFLEALNEDWIRFRADSTENSIVREQVRNASPKWVSLVDAAREFGSDAQSAGPLAGHELFFEHVHLTPKGNYQLAKLLGAEVSRVVFGDGQPKAQWLDETECARAIGLTPFGELTLLRRMDELTARPPFTAQLDFAEERSRLKREIEALDAQLSKPSEWSPILASLEAALQRDPTPFLMFHLASAQAQVGHWVRALELNDQLALQEPVSPERIAQRAFLLQRLGRVNEAEALLLESAERDPFYFQTYGLLGSLWAERKEGAKARAYFESLVKRMPDNRAGRQMLAQFYSATDEAKAEEQWRAILDTAPDDEESLVALVERLFRTRRADEALTIMLRAYRYNPRNFANASRLEQIFEDKGDVEKTVEFMEAMAESGPVRPVLYADLAEKLVQLHRYDEAAFYKARGVNAARVVRDEALVRQLSAMSVPQ